MITARKLLVAAADYEVMLAAHEALAAEARIEIERAYSYRDALYTIRHTRFHAALVDARLHHADNRTGDDNTLSAIAGQYAVPLIAYDPEGQYTDHIRSAGALTLRTLESAAIRQAVSQVLQLPDDVETAALGAEGRITHTLERVPAAHSEWTDEETRAFLQLTRSLTEVLDLDEVLNRVVEAARRLTAADEGMLLLPDGDSGPLILRAMVGIEQEAARNFRINTHDTIAGQVYATGQPILIGAQGPQKVKTKYFVNALLYVPVGLKGRTLGVLGVNNRQRDDVFVERHQDLLTNLAAYAAIAIQNARTHGQSLRRARELKNLVEASDQINRSLSFEVMPLHICGQLAQVLEVPRAALYEWHPASARLTLMGFTGDAGGEPRASIDLTACRDVTRALEKRVPLSAVNEETAGGLGALILLEAVGARALLALPLVVEGQSQALLIAAETGNRRFSARDVDLGRALAGQAATALQNARLLSDLETSLRQLRETQNRLVQSARLSAMGELAAAVAHQISNPLTTIVLDAELLLLKEEDTEDRRALSAIVRSGKWAGGVVKRLLSGVRPRVEGANAIFVPTSVEATIGETLTLIESRTRRQGIRLQWQPPDMLPRVLAASGDLDDVWLNLLLNAHDALIGQHAPRIEVRALYDEAAREVVVTMQDNGVGIAPEVQREMFQPFFTTKPTGEGTGLGLYICRQTVERLGGSIHVESELGSYTRFEVRLPASMDEG